MYFYTQKNLLLLIYFRSDYFNKTNYNLDDLQWMVCLKKIWISRVDRTCENSMALKDKKAVSLIRLYRKINFSSKNLAGKLGSFMGIIFLLSITPKELHL